MTPGTHRRGPFLTALLVSLLATTLAFGPVGAQETTEGDADRGAMTAAPASVSDFTWMAGAWRGSLPDGSVTEVDYMPPAGGVLPGHFRLLRDGRTLLLEAITLVEEEGGLSMYVRHFDPALVPMEEGAALRLRFVGRDGDSWRFENVDDDRNPVRSAVTRTAAGFLAVSELLRPDGSTGEIRVAWTRPGRG